MSLPASSPSRLYQDSSSLGLNLGVDLGPASSPSRLYQDSSSLGLNLGVDLGVDLSVDLGGVGLASCLMNASGCRCGEPEELAALMAVPAVDGGAVVGKSGTAEARDGHALPRLALADGGSLNAMGLPNRGHAFYAEYALRPHPKPFVVSLRPSSPKELRSMLLHLAACAATGFPASAGPAHFPPTAARPVHFPPSAATVAHFPSSAATVASVAAIGKVSTTKVEDVSSSKAGDSSALAASGVCPSILAPASGRRVLVEINLSCPNVFVDERWGLRAYLEAIRRAALPAAPRRIAGAGRAAGSGTPGVAGSGVAVSAVGGAGVSAGATFTVGVKLPPLFGARDFDHVCGLLLKYADCVRFVTAINSVPNALLVDADARTTALHACEGFGGMGGGFCKPLGLANVVQLHRRLGKAIQIVGCGGVSSGRDALEYILCGASAVQVGTHLLKNGPSCLKTIAAELRALVHKAGAKTVADLVGTLKVAPPLPAPVAALSSGSPSPPQLRSKL